MNENRKPQFNFKVDPPDLLPEIKEAAEQVKVTQAQLVNFSIMRTIGDIKSGKLGKFLQQTDSNKEHAITV